MRQNDGEVNVPANAGVDSNAEGWYKVIVSPVTLRRQVRGKIAG